MATRKTAAKAEALKVSQIGDFKKRLGGIIELPSGLVVKWRNPGGLRAFLSEGVIPNSLLPMIENSLKNKQGVDEQELSELIKDTDRVAEMMKMYDNIAMRCIVEPKIYPVPTWDDVTANNEEHPDAPAEEPGDLRYEDRLYADELPDDDKMYLFQLITGGTKDLETFRKQQEINVGSLARVSGVAGVTVDSVGTDEG